MAFKSTVAAQVSTRKVLNHFKLLAMLKKIAAEVKNFAKYKTSKYWTTKK